LVPDNEHVIPSKHSRSIAIEVPQSTCHGSQSTCHGSQSTCHGSTVCRSVTITVCRSVPLTVGIPFVVPTAITAHSGLQAEPRLTLLNYKTPKSEHSHSRYERRPIFLIDFHAVLWFEKLQKEDYALRNRELYGTTSGHGSQSTCSRHNTDFIFFPLFFPLFLIILLYHISNDFGHDF
jgi:hypothetical protein